MQTIIPIETYDNLNNIIIIAEQYAYLQLEVMIGITTILLLLIFISDII